MLNDILFFGAAAAISSGIVAFALSFGDVPDIVIQEVCEDGYEFSGEDLNRLTLVSGTNYSFSPETALEPAYMVMYSVTPKDLAPPSAGIFMPVSQGYLNIFNGKRIKVTVTARKHSLNGLDNFEMSYFSRAFKQGKWREYTLTSDFKPFSYEINLPQYDGELDMDFLGVWPGKEGDESKMDVQSMRIDIVSGCAV